MRKRINHKVHKANKYILDDEIVAFHYNYYLAFSDDDSEDAIRRFPKCDIKSQIN